MPALNRYGQDRCSAYLVVVGILGVLFIMLVVFSQSRTARRWSTRLMSNEAKVEAVAEAAKAAGYRDIYRQSLITLNEMEKLMSKAKFSEILGDLIEKPPGKPALVPITDKRPEIHTSAQQDFKEET